MKKQSFFQRKNVIAAFGILALLGGFFFLNFGTFNPFTGKVTGNFVASNFLPFSLISIIGMLLISCSAILIIYALVKKK